MQQRLTPTLLDNLSPRRGPTRPVWVTALLLFPSAALILLLVFPSVLDLLHCSLTLGAAQRCTPTTQPTVSLNAASRAAIARSCTPLRPGAKIIFVTGTAGFIGYWSARRLRERGDGVLGLDNFNNYYPVSLKEARNNELLQAGVYTVRGDMNDEVLVRELFSVRQLSLHCIKESLPVLPF